MASFNKVILVGNITADPELKQTTSGNSVCNFTLAYNRRPTRGQEAQSQQTVDFFNIVAWGQDPLSEDVVPGAFAEGDIAMRTEGCRTSFRMDGVLRGHGPRIPSACEVIGQTQVGHRDGIRGFTRFASGQGRPLLRMAGKGDG